MKNLNQIRLIKLLLIFLISGLSVYAQMPNKISFQSVIRNTQGVLVTNTTVGLRFSILPDTTGSAPVYVETNQATTNSIGLLTAQIGAGTATTGTFSAINWGSNSYYLKMEADPSGGTSYTLSSQVQLLTVPYAFAAKTAQTVTGLTDSISAIA